MIGDQSQLRGCLPSRSARLLSAVLCTVGLLPGLPFAVVRGATVDAAPVKRHIAHNQKEEQYFELRYGIGQVRVHAVSAESSLEFRCLVLDAGKANSLKESRSAPMIIDRKTGKKLTVSTAAGKSHQTSAPEPGQEYWVEFGDRDKTVKPGNMVDVVIGTVRMSGLIVQ
jgi:hypothetical protein